MSNIIELKPPKREKKIRAIEFMQNLIKELEKDNLDPDKIVVFMKWKDQFNEKGECINEKFDYWDNIKETESLLACCEFLRHQIFKNILE